MNSRDDVFVLRTLNDVVYGVNNNTVGWVGLWRASKG